MKRRHFIKSAATAGIVIPSVFNGFFLKAVAANPLVKALQHAATDTDHVLVLIQLGGGNDGLNTFVPLDQYSAL